MVEAAIECRDLVRIYAEEGIEVQALQGLNLRVASGDLVAIVGASGSGKSTLLNILSGLDRPTAGSARVAGRDLGTMSRRARVDYRRRTVGFLWQQTSRNLLPYLTARENVVLPALLARRSGGPERADGLLADLGIRGLADRRYDELSGGEQQRVAIATALVNEPAVLLADEPTGELDEATSAEVLETMRTVNRETGITVLIVTHDAAVSEHVRRTVQIRDGRISTEVLRSGSEEQGLTAEEFTVIDEAGRLQLPRDYTARLGLRDRVRLALQPDRVEVFPGRDDDG